MTVVTVVAFPRDANPYQELLHAALLSYDVKAGYLPTPTPSRTLNLLLLPMTLTRSRLAGSRILHLHWVFAFALPGSAKFPILRMLAQAWFGLVLLTCRALGMQIMWTAHNVLPHDPVFWDDRVARRMLLRATTHLIVHDKRVVDELTALIGGPEDLPPFTVIPHGSYDGWYAQGLDRSQARDLLGLPQEATVLLFFGRVTAQKGVLELATAFTRLCKAPAPTAGGGTSLPLLVVAGQCTDLEVAAVLAGTAADLRGRMRLDLRYLPDAELATYLSASDAAVLPFRTSTTSGSVVLTMTFGRVAVLPDLPAFQDLPAEACVRYDPAAPDGLRDAMAEICAMATEELARRGSTARTVAVGASWDEAARLTADVYRSSLAGGS